MQKLKAHHCKEELKDFLILYGSSLFALFIALHIPDDIRLSSKHFSVKFDKSQSLFLFVPSSYTPL
jgi:hypothetical protein